MTKKPITVVAKSAADQDMIEEKAKKHGLRAPLDHEWELLEGGRALFPRKAIIECDENFGFSCFVLSDFIL